MNEFSFGHEETRLEELLRLSALEPAHRPEFYKVLMESDIFVLGKPSDSTPPDEEQTVHLEAQSTIDIIHWETLGPGLEQSLVCESPALVTEIQT